MWRGILVGCLIVLIGLGMALGWGYLYVQRTMGQPLQLPEEPWLLNVSAGSSLAAVARQLESQGIITDSRILRHYGQYYGYAPRIQAGEYALTGDLNGYSLLALLVSGRVVQYSVTLIDGHRFTDFRAALTNAQALTQTLNDVADALIMAQLDAPGVHPEGQFFPETYFYTRGTTDLEMLRRAFARMQSTLETAWHNRAPDLPYQSAYEALIMASIVERETSVAAERDQIAGVFVRRLQQGMRLQTDPTVIYGMGDAYQGRITRADLRRPTPYNTYVIRGLPPTPIANPGRAAIEAALNPRAGRELFFVARGDGTHQFSETLEEHNRAVRQYQLNRREDYRSTPLVK